MKSRMVKNIGKKKQFLAKYRAKYNASDQQKRVEKPSRVKIIVDDEGNALEYKFTMVRSKFCKIITFVVCLFIAAIFFYFFKTSSGSYISAWYFSIVVAILLLYIISMPIYISVSRSMIEMHALLELTPVAFTDIRRIYRIDKYRLRAVVPMLLASYGFGGFFGYYIDLKQMKLVKFNATRLSNLIAIEDVYNEKHIISCDDPELFIKIVREGVSRSLKERDASNNNLDSENLDE